MAFLFDLGYSFGKWQPGVVVDWVKLEGQDDLEAQFLGTHLTLAYWLDGHNTNIKLDVGLVKDHGVAFADAPVVTTLQTQLFF